MFCPHTQRYMVGVLPLTREWIEITHVRVEMSVDVFSLSRGSGLKSLDSDVSKLGAAVLPLTREWIEISSVLMVLQRSMSSPSHEGVD